MAKRKFIWRKPTEKQKRERIYHIHIRLTDYRMTEIREFVDHSWSGMAGEWNRFSARFDAATKGFNPDEVAEYVDAIYDHMALLRDVSPKLNRQSHCMMVYGTFESALANMCHLVDHHKLVTTKLPTQLHMKEIKQYLESHISKRAWGDEWRWMDELRIVRNAFAHSGGRVAQIDKVTKKPILGSRWASILTFMGRNQKAVSLTHNDEIVVEDGLIDRAITKATDSLAKFHKGVYSLYR